jgi:integrase
MAFMGVIFMKVSIFFGKIIKKSHVLRMKFDLIVPEDSLERIMRVVGADTNLRDLTNEHIHDFVKLSFEEGRSPVEINEDLALAKSLFSTPNLVKSVNLPKLYIQMVPVFGGSPISLTIDEIIRFMTLEKDRKTKNVCGFLAWTGITKEEARRLDWIDVHLDEQEPYIIVDSSREVRRKVVLIEPAIPFLGDVRMKGQVFRGRSVANAALSIKNILPLITTTWKDIRCLRLFVFEMARSLDFAQKDLLIFNDTIRLLGEYIETHDVILF